MVQVVSGAGAGRRTHLQRGQTLTVGRTEFAGFALTDHRDLEQIHFSVAFEDHGFVVTDQSGNGIQVNDDLVDATQLKDGDRILAGETEFRIHIHSMINFAGVAGSGDRQETLSLNGFPFVDAPGDNQDQRTSDRPERSAQGLVTYLEMNEACPEIVESCEGVKDCLDALCEHNRHFDAVRVLAYCLPRRKAVWWALTEVERIMSGGFTELEEVAVSRAADWCRESSEEKRRLAWDAVAPAGYQSAAAWTSLGVFWSGSNMAPVGRPVVQTEERLSSKAVASAIQIAALTTTPSEALARYEECLAAGLIVAGQTDPWKAG